MNNIINKSQENNTIKKSMNKPEKLTLNKSNKKSINKSQNEPINKSSNLSSNKIINKSFMHSNNKDGIKIVHKQENKKDKSNNPIIKKGTDFKQSIYQSRNQSDNQSINASNKESKNNSETININDEAKTYFNCIIAGEENPITLDINTNIRYYNLENVFNSFYPVDSLQIAKEISKEERLIKKLKDPSFTYGEIVNILLLILFIFIIFRHSEQWPIFLNILEIG